jgi:hypothetical protein
MYVKSGCRFARLRSTWRPRMTSCVERDTTQNAARKAELMRYTRNGGVVPTIVCNDAADYKSASRSDVADGCSERSVAGVMSALSAQR